MKLDESQHVAFFSSVVSDYDGARSFHEFILVLCCAYMWLAHIYTNKWLCWTDFQPCPSLWNGSSRAAQLMHDVMQSKENMNCTNLLLLFATRFNVFCGFLKFKPSKYSGKYFQSQTARFSIKRSFFLSLSLHNHIESNVNWIWIIRNTLYLHSSCFQNRECETEHFMHGHI